MKTIWIVPIEPIDSRYTKQWYENIPKILNERIKESNLDFNVVTCNGKQSETGTTEGAFLDFAVTNIYKATQVELIGELFSKGKIKAGDKFLVTDAWNFVVTSIRYMSELLDIPVEIHGIWHAGAYDPTDILGMKMSKPWPWLQEKAWYHAIDHNYYATDFHKRMFLHNLEIGYQDTVKAHRSGQPHDYIIEPLEELGATVKKVDKVIWPHRYNADKQPEIAESLKSDFDMVITAKMNLDKYSYYNELASSKVIFSCALHENLGISVMEATLAGVIPVVPDRCSYAEMYLDAFKYPSVWTQDAENFEAYKPQLVKFIQERMNNPEKFSVALKQQQIILKTAYLNADVMINKLLDK